MTDARMSAPRSRLPLLRLRGREPLAHRTAQEGASIVAMSLNVVTHAGAWT